MTEDFRSGFIVGCVLVFVVGIFVMDYINNSESAEQRYVDDCVDILTHEDNFRGHSTSDEEYNGYADGCQIHYHNR